MNFKDILANIATFEAEFDTISTHEGERQKQEQEYQKKAKAAKKTGARAPKAPKLELDWKKAQSLAGQIQKMYHETLPAWTAIAESMTDTNPAIKAQLAELRQLQKDFAESECAADLGKMGPADKGFKYLKMGRTLKFFHYDVPQIQKNIGAIKGCLTTIAPLIDAVTIEANPNLAVLVRNSRSTHEVQAEKTEIQNSTTETMPESHETQNSVKDNPVKASHFIPEAEFEEVESGPMLQLPSHDDQLPPLSSLIHYYIAEIKSGNAAKMKNRPVKNKNIKLTPVKRRWFSKSYAHESEYNIYSFKGHGGTYLVAFPKHETTAYFDHTNNRPFIRHKIGGHGGKWEIASPRLLKFFKKFNMDSGLYWTSSEKDVYEVFDTKTGETMPRADVSDFMSLPYAFILRPRQTVIQSLWHDVKAACL